MARFTGRTEVEISGVNQMPAKRSLAFAPGDLLLEIAGYLDSRTDVFNFSLTVRYFPIYGFELTAYLNF
jgi:hypothetical protein